MHFFHSYIPLIRSFICSILCDFCVEKLFMLSANILILLHPTGLSYITVSQSILRSQLGLSNISQMEIQKLLWTCLMQLLVGTTNCATLNIKSVHLHERAICLNPVFLYVLSFSYICSVLYVRIHVIIGRGRFWLRCSMSLVH